MKIYLAGPMRGIPEFNFPAFNEAAAVLRERGHEVFNPAESDVETHNGVDISKGNATGDEAQLVQQHGFSKRDAFYRDTRFICLEADAIAMLPGWEHSLGAQAEWALAKALGHEIMYLGVAQ